jgi:hypothetical protein
MKRGTLRVNLSDFMGGGWQFHVLAQREWRMKTVGSRGAFGGTSVLLAALLMSIGCGLNDGSLRVKLLNGGGEGGWSVDVSGPQFSNRIYQLPTGAGATLNLALPGDTGESIKFTAKFTDVSGTVEATNYCTTTVPITSFTGTDYGQITVSQVNGAVVIQCCGGWEEMQC